MASRRTMLTPPLTFLGVKLIEDGNEILVTEVDIAPPVARIVSMGILPGMVPPYEEHDARIEAGYSPEQWYELHWWERALEYAHYRIRKAAQAVMADKAEQKAKRQMRGGRRK